MEWRDGRKWAGRWTNSTMVIAEGSWLAAARPAGALDVPVAIAVAVPVADCDNVYGATDKSDVVDNNNNNNNNNDDDATVAPSAPPLPK